MNQEKQSREHIETVQDQQFLKAVRAKYERGPLERQYRKDATRIKWISLAPQVLSILTALYAVIFVAELYSGWRFAGLIVLGSVLLVALEWGKRFFATQSGEGFHNPDRSAKTWFALPLMVLVGLSFTVSWYGGDKFIQEESAGPEVVRNSLIDSINNQIHQAEADIALMKNQTWRGKIVRDANATIKNLQSRVNQLTAQRIELEGRDLMQNDELGMDHQARIVSLGMAFGSLAGMMDFILVALLFWSERLEYNAYLLTKRNGTERNATERKKRKRNGTDKSLKDSDKNVPRNVPGFKIAAQRNGTEQWGSDTKRSCDNCGADISHRTSRAKYCSDACRMEHFKKG